MLTTGAQTQRLEPIKEALIHAPGLFQLPCNVHRPTCHAIASNMEIYYTDDVLTLSTRPPSP